MRRSCAPRSKLATEDAEDEADPIVAEVRAGRERLAARFDFDIDAIVRHVQKLEAEEIGARAPSPRGVAVAVDAAKERAMSQDALRMGASPASTAGPPAGDQPG